MPTKEPPDRSVPIGELLPSWELELRARRLSKNTLQNYRNGVRAYIGWAAATDRPTSLTAVSVRTFVAEMLEAGLAPTTARSRLTALKSFSAWCAAEDEIAEDEVAPIAPPQLGKKKRPMLSEEDMAALLATCDTKTFEGKRDDAVLRMLWDSGGRAGELTALKVDSVNVVKGRILFHGKGDKERFAGFRPETARSLDRYLRARRTHRLATLSDKLWLGANGRGFEYGALWAMINRRAAQAALGHIHPHMIRRSFAHHWLKRGGSMEGLRSVGGWEDYSMIKLYAGDYANERALDEYSRLFGSG